VKRGLGRGFGGVVSVGELADEGARAAGLVADDGD
jgi:hypothetical protein